MTEVGLLFDFVNHACDFVPGIETAPIPIFFVLSLRFKNKRDTGLGKVVFPIIVIVHPIGDVVHSAGSTPDKIAVDAVAGDPLTLEDEYV